MAFIQVHSRSSLLSTATESGFTVKMMLLGLCTLLCFGVRRSSSEILHRQKRNWIIDSFSIDEGYKGSFPYSLGKIQVENNYTLFEIHGQGVDEEPKNTLQINSYTGEITVLRPVDYEKYQVFKLKFQAYDREKRTLETQLGIEVQILDRNDNPPKFEAERYEISIKEWTVQGTEVITLKARDYDINMNGKFTFEILSVIPKPHDLEFSLIQNEATQTGTISFKGCLDHERAEKYTIIVQAKDSGTDIQLSSSCTVIINIEDGNNHLPVITGQTGSGRVKEGEENTLVSRLQVRDEDTKGTAAWRAKYQIQGDTNNNFRITTDPETNEGLLYVEKNLDYEDSPQKNVTITVENEIPYHSCKVVSRSSTGLWEVVITSVATGGGAIIGGVTGAGTIIQSTYTVTVTVEDVNEPPIFVKPNQQVSLGENLGEGQYLVTFTARDNDISTGNAFVYRIGDDPADWLTVDRVTGKVTTSKSIDRESPFVKDNIYRVTINAIDSGKPPMTSTATLSIHIMDDNDNTPTLNVNIVHMCQSDVPSLANITVSDLDEEPYGGPFGFKLLGDVEGRWRVEPSHGYSVNLVKDSTVHSGEFKVLLEVSDLQHKTSVHNLSVTVCDCLDTARPNCYLRSSGSTVGVGAFGAIFFSILLFAGMLLLVILMSCKDKTIEIPYVCLEQNLMIYNTEKPGTDCKVAFEPFIQGHIQTKQVPAIPLMQLKNNSANGVSQGEHKSFMEQDFKHKIYKTTQNSVATGASSTMRTRHKDLNFMQELINNSTNEVSQEEYKSFMEQEFQRRNYEKTLNSVATGASSTVRSRHKDLSFRHKSWMMGHEHSNVHNTGVHHETLFKVLNTMLDKLQAPGAELGDYDPHVYAEEGILETDYEIEAISIPDVSFDLDLDPDLYFKFSNLASICMPCESTAYNAITTCVVGKLETTTLIQAESQKTCIDTHSHF